MIKTFFKWLLRRRVRTVAPQSPGMKAASGSSEATVGVAPQGAGMKHAFGGSTVTVKIPAPAELDERQKP